MRRVEHGQVGAVEALETSRRPGTRGSPAGGKRLDSRPWRAGQHPAPALQLQPFLTAGGSRASGGGFGEPSREPVGRAR